MSAAARALTLSLISHTNAGKTTLARTLLRRDVGEVFDQAHVTLESQRYTLLPPGPDDGGIELWDTPGFGDSARLLREVEGREQPLDWLAEQRFDPVTQRALHSSQCAVVNVVEHADVILYLVNASEDPVAAGYVEPEMRILGWTQRPVIVVLNHTGSPMETDARRRAEERWRWHLASHAAVRDVISLDAFTRCWVQEGLLLLRLEALVEERSTPLAMELLERWRDENLSVLTGSACELAKLLIGVAADAEPVGEAWLPRLVRRRAAAALAERLVSASRRCFDRMLELHVLEGAGAVWARGQLDDIALPGRRPDPLRSGLIGGAVGGALGGLVADAAVAGLSLGGGALAGALLGGLGMGAFAWATEQLGGEREPKVVWSTDYLARLTQQSVQRYLAVAHCGRGGGRYRERVDPEFWAPLVERELGRELVGLSQIWERARGADAGAEAPLAELLERVLRRCLVDLYPGSERFLGA